jgi:hypothetical protein
VIRPIARRVRMTEDVAASARGAHQDLREELLRAERAGGETGRAARGVIQVLFPHMIMEERYALPALRLLPRLARGEVALDTSPEIDRVLRSSEGLRRELPIMLDEHRRIVEALAGLMRAAAEERHEGWAQLATKLVAHVEQEEEFLYPAAILVGDYIRLSRVSGAARTEPGPSPDGKEAL